MNRCQLYLEPAAWDFEARKQSQGPTLGAHMALWKQRAKGPSIQLAGWSCTQMGEERNTGSRGIVGGTEGGARVL